jgi:hypothetical protein
MQLLVCILSLKQYLFRIQRILNILGLSDQDPKGFLSDLADPDPSLPQLYYY